MSDKSKINNLNDNYKNNFSKTTENLIRNLQQISNNNNLNLIKKYVKNKDLDKYVSLLFNLYKIKYYLEVVDCETIEKNSNLCNTFELLSYLRNNSMDNYYYKSINFKKNNITLNNIIDDLNVEGCKIWMNIWR